jgi:hypothetical protein
MTIDRRALVARHRITLTQPNAMSPLSVGNGEFAFTADITGLQTFPEFHSQGLAHVSDVLRGKPVDPATFSMPIGTQSQWGWHTMPNPQGYMLEDALSAYQTARGPVTYPDRYDFMAAYGGQGDQAAGTWLYNNPQRLDLGQIGLISDVPDRTARPRRSPISARPNRRSTCGRGDSRAASASTASRCAC